MGSILLVHIVAGALGLATGFVALYVAKGAKLHRTSGVTFVYAMLTMCLAGLVVAAGRVVAPAINIPMGLLTAYLVVTSLTTVRPPARGARALEVGAMMVVWGVAAAMLAFGFIAVANGNGIAFGIPAPAYFVFGAIALLGGIGDVRVLRSATPLRGAPRIARHLWRMTFALFIAAFSFFVGQADVFPAALRSLPLRLAPVLLVLVTMFYWLWRVRIRRSLRGVVQRVVEAPVAASAPAAAAPVRAA